MREVAIAATVDKEHIQQMTSTNEDLLKIVKTQQEQITQLIKQNGEFTTALAKKGGNQKNEEKVTFEKDNNEADPTKKKGYGCAICGKHHKTEDCLELDKNKARCNLSLSTTTQNKKAMPEGFVYVAVKTCMYRLPQSRVLAQELLKQRLNAYGYTQSLNAPARSHMVGTYCTYVLIARYFIFL